MIGPIWNSVAKPEFEGIFAGKAARGLGVSIGGIDADSWTGESGYARWWDTGLGVGIPDGRVF